MKEASIAARITAVLILALVVAGQVERGICFARNTEVPGGSSVLWYIALFCLICYWLEMYSRERRVMRVWDMGFFMSFAWPIILSYYVVKTRGIKRSLLALFLFVMVSASAYRIAIVLYRLH
jgi:hypothetical protein